MGSEHAETSTDGFSLSEGEDVKPFNLQPFPLDVPDKTLYSQGTANPKRGQDTIATKTSFSQPPETPPRAVKRELSPLSLTKELLRKRPESPIYISSDTDSDEVDAQIELRASQATNELEANNGDSAETESDELRDEDEEQEDAQMDDEDTPINDVEKSTAVADPELQLATPQHQASRKLSFSSSPSLSPSPPPFRLSATDKPGLIPKTASLSHSPSKSVNKRPRPPNALPATQPVASSSRQPHCRMSGTAGRLSPSKRASDTAATSALDEDDKRYTKRARTDRGSSTRSSGKALKRRTRNDNYWFLDGSVVVQLGDVMFRLHRSRLASQSTYFEQLFSSTPGKNGVDFFDFVDECPVYSIQGVSVSDFEELLVAMDNAILYVFKPPEFAQLASILRASQKLHFSSLEDFASRILQEMWPRDLNKITVARIKHASETIVLARDCEMPELLKRAFYELVRKARLGEDEDADADDPDVARTQISRQDLARLIKTREELVSRWILTAGSPPEIFCPLASVDPPSDESARCLQARANNLVHWHESVKKTLFEECLYDPLVGLQRLAEIKWEELGYCRECVKAWRDSWLAQREKLWQQLDIWLGLPVDEDEET